MTVLADLYPELSAEDLKVAEENIDRYLGLMLRISQRIDVDSKARAAEVSTSSEQAVGLAGQQEHGM